MRKQLIICVVMLCIIGCQPYPDNATGQGSIKSQSMSKFDENQIKLVVCEYMIEKEIKPSAGNLLFVAIDSDELQKLAQKFPACRVKKESEAEITEHREVQDKSTKQGGVIIEVKSISVSNQNANVYAGYFAGAAITFTFKLEKQTDWRIIAVTGKAIADPM